MLSHQAMLSCAHAVSLVTDATGIRPLAPGKRHISFLPLAHIFEQAVHIMIFLKVRDLPEF